MPSKPKLTIPFAFPRWSLNSFTVRVFNSLYYWNGQRKSGKQLVDLDSYFYPLDAVIGWNKIYGPSGFAQFQCVLPLETADGGLRTLLSAIANMGVGSFLAVLKRFGAQESKFSFPMEGFTLALDFPVNKKTLALMEQLDEITVRHGGRFYLAKDSRMSRSVFQQSEARAQEYSSYRKNLAASDVFGSAQSKRLGL